MRQRQRATVFVSFLLVAVGVASPYALAANLRVNCDKHESIGKALRLLANTHGSLVETTQASSARFYDYQRRYRGQMGVSEIRQTAIKPMAEGTRYEFAYQWTLPKGMTPPKQINVDIIGAKDIRVIDMTTSSFAVTVTKATDPGLYDLYANGRIRSGDVDETVAARSIPFEVTGGGARAAQ